MRTFKELRKLTDQQLEEEYDKKAKSSIADLSFFRDEIFKRASTKMTKTMKNLTWCIFFLTLLNVTCVLVSIFCIY